MRRKNYLTGKEYYQKLKNANKVLWFLALVLVPLGMSITGNIDVKYFLIIAGSCIFLSTLFVSLEVSARTPSDYKGKYYFEPDKAIAMITCISIGLLVIAAALLRGPVGHLPVTYGNIALATPIISAVCMVLFHSELFMTSLKVSSEII